jgi:Na+/H+ antiporter
LSAPILLFLIFAAIVVFAVVAKRLELPYPIVFVIGGGALALVPGLPRLELAPEWIFLTVLPPLLFSGGWTTDWNVFRQNIRPITLLAVGLVLVTTAAVAAAIEALIPGFGWASAFVLGAIVAPPDAVAASAVFERFSVPRRIVAILDGEGLVNDGTALVLYRFAVAAAATGTFSPVAAAGSFVLVVSGGIAVGLVLAWLIEGVARLLQRLSLTDETIDNLLLLVAPYIVYLSAESLGASGVLATVTAGILLGRRSAHYFGPEARLIAYSVWALMIYLLNALVFLLIGLELRSIVESGPPGAVMQWIPAALVVSAVVIVVRIAWVFPATYLPRWLSPRLRQADPSPSWRAVVVIAWTGLRGIVSLAAALALPLHDAAGRPFPQRGAIIVITFGVILVTLVGQGLSLIPLVRWLRVEAPDTREREIQVRVQALEAGLRRLRELEHGLTSPAEWETLGRAQAEYQNRIEHLNGHTGESGTGGESEASQFDHRVQAAALDAERREITRLRSDGAIPDDIFRKVEYDLDLASARLQ